VTADECDAPLHGVVVNDEGQYSIWPLVLDLPAGWQLQGSTGTRAECLAVIARIWTDLVPRSARREPKV
jgi:MbtH protein